MKRTYYIRYTFGTNPACLFHKTEHDMDTVHGMKAIVGEIASNLSSGYCNTVFPCIFIDYWKELNEEQPLSVQLAVQQLNEIGGGDFEVAHSKADGILLSFLQAAGYTEVVHAYNEARDRCEFQYA